MMIVIEYYKGSGGGIKPGGNTRRRYINPNNINDMGAEIGENDITMANGMSYNLTPGSMKKLRVEVKAPELRARKKR